MRQILSIIIFLSIAFNAYASVPFFKLLGKREAEIPKILQMLPLSPSPGRLVFEGASASERIIFRSQAGIVRRIEYYLTASGQGAYSEALNMFFAEGFRAEKIGNRRSSFVKNNVRIGISLSGSGRVFITASYK